eukprot:NODE_4031_length_853_cov_33.903581_g3874_i0.p1 GENE.NODE_4031_length_853_cov_33.903581_g3874_i0~~NODE_4031_length_853_cov_33.903581_g3874_i0.p1  ORF type:complete len:250 (-),score=41.27 NODE_4031_length_853_cov_33.903581_g3874_i0:103-852(-)
MQPGNSSDTSRQPIDPNSTTICVANLPLECTEREFRLMFKFAWGFEVAILTRSKKTRSLIGYARFATREQAEHAINILNGFPTDIDWLSHTVKSFVSSTQLDESKRDKQGPREHGLRGRRHDTAASTSVYVGGIPHEWDEAYLWSMFANYGTVTHLQLREGSNPLIGKVAFVFFSHQAEAVAAIAGLHGCSLDGVARHLVVRRNTSQSNAAQMGHKMGVLSRLDQLKVVGIISEEEYCQKKATLAPPPG